MTVPLREMVRERLKKQGKLRKITLEDLALNSKPEQAWIAVEGYVYDITEHVKRHAGWKCGCAVSELMAILRCLGTDCTDEVLEIHSHHAMQMMQPYMIGELASEKDETATGGAVEHAENRKLNSCCPFTMSIDKPVLDKEPEALNLCKR